MAKENKIINIIKSRIQAAQNGTLFFNNSFPEFDDEYVGQILSDLAKDGIIHHLSRGVYLKTEETRFGLVYPPIEDIAEAIARRDNAQVIPTGATAQNILGLSTQVPMNAVFLTSGSARIIKLGNRTIAFRRAVPKNFAVKGNMIDMAVGIIIGGAFGKIVTSLVSDVIMPPIGLLVGGVNFTDLKIVLKDAVENGAEARPIEIALDFLSRGDYDVLSFGDAEDRPDGYAVGRGLKACSDRFLLALKPCGGFAAWLRRR